MNNTATGATEVVLFDRVERCIYLVRGQKVMLSTDLARLYEVEPKVLMQAVKRNTDRFPGDFMFPFARQEVAILKSQIVTSSWGGIRRAMPYAFTERGTETDSGEGKTVRERRAPYCTTRKTRRSRKT